MERARAELQASVRPSGSQIDGGVSADWRVQAHCAQSAVFFCGLQSARHTAHGVEHISRQIVAVEEDHRGGLL